MSNPTQGERLARIETLLESLPEIRADLKAIRDDLDAHKAELEKFKNRGSGILIGVGLAAGGIGAGIVKAWQGVFG